MKAKRDIKSISYIKSHAAKVLSQVNQTHKPVYITQNGEAKAVLMDTDSYESIRKASTLLKLISFGENDINSGKIKEQNEFFDELETKLKKL